MVNKSVLAVAVVVLVGTLGIGVVVGTQLGGPAAPPADQQTTDGDETGGNEAGTATPTGPSTETATPEPTSSSQTEREPYVPAKYYNETRIEAYAVEFINERREAQGLRPMSADGRTAEQLGTMARNHSVAMATAGKYVHEINGTDSADRYRKNDLYSTCTFRVREYSERPDGNSFEAVGTTVAGREYTENGNERFNVGERGVAKALVSYWFETRPYNERVTYQNAERMGVGVNVTEAGDVYATVNVCG